MGRSQRHMVYVQNAPANGEAGAEGQPAPGYILQAGQPPALREANLENLQVVEGPPGGPLQGSSLSGAIPETLIPEPAPGFGLGSIVPTEAEMGSADLTLHVHGSAFEDGAVIVFNGGDEATTFVSTTELTTTVKPSLAAVAGAVPVTVRNAGGAVSNELSFTFTEAAVEGLAERTGPFTISRIADHPDGVAITLAEAGDVRVGDTVTVEATGNTGVNGEYTILAVDGLTIVVDNDLLLTSPVEGKGRLMVAGGR